MVHPDIPLPGRPLPTGPAHGVPGGAPAPGAPEPAPEPLVSGAAVLRVREPGELVAAIPVLLGFHPRESLVLVATGGSTGRRLGLTLRADLPPPEHRAIVAESAVRSLLLDAPAGAVVLVVAAPTNPWRGRAGPGSPAAPPARELVHEVAAALARHGVDAHTVVWAEATTAGARWGCYDPCGCVGVLPDPAGTPFAAAAAVDGQVVRSGREQLERSVAPADAARIRRREVMLIEAHDVATGDASGELGGGHHGGAPGIAVVDAALEEAAAGRLALDDARVVALAMALAQPAVRDEAIRRSAGSRSAAAEHLWAALVREMPDPEAAEPAALLAVSALLRGDGALANVALDRAERAWPGHRLTRLLRSAAEACMRPGELRACLRGGDLGAGTAIGTAIYSTEEITHVAAGSDSDGPGASGRRRRRRRR
jgi:hypothetical protein